MNERDIQGLMEQYREGLGHCGKVPARRARSYWRPGLVAAGLTAAAGVAFFFLLPRDAAAEAIKQVAHALKNVKSMQLSTTVYTEGRWWEISRAYYKNGRWRNETFLGRPLESVYIRDKDRLLTSHKQLNHATVHPTSWLFEGWGPSDDIDVLEYVTDWQTNFGYVSEEREIKLAESAPVKGRPTYKIILTRKSTDYYAEILVDRQSQLPISSYYRFYNDENQSRTTYSFDKNLPDDLFSFDIGKPVYDLAKDQEQLSKTWDKPLAELQGTSVRDVSVTSDGTVWIAVTTPDQFLASLPVELSSDLGTRYIRYGQDIHPSGNWGKHPQKICGEECQIVGFTPLTLSTSMPKKVEVNFVVRNVTGIGLEHQKPVKGSGVIKQSFVPRREAGEFPSYFVTLDLDHYCFQLPANIDHARAEALQKENRFEEAARSYELAAEAYKRFIPHLGRKELRLAKKCREKAMQQ
jgi:outer membrane lipoprotein-sorting protein